MAGGGVLRNQELPVLGESKSLGLSMELELYVSQIRLF